MRAQLTRTLTAGVAVALISLTAACSTDPPSQAALKDKLKTESLFKSLSDTQVDCVAGVLIKYAKAGDLKDYVAGKKAFGSVQSPKSKNEAITNETAACVTAK